MRIIGVDPSGAYNEGKGTTGICVLDEGKPIQFLDVAAQDYGTRLDYWNGVLHSIGELLEPGDVISMEDYVLYSSSAKAQINSEMETSKLIGAIELWAHNEGITLYKRNASQVKKRWSNEILEFKKLIKLTNGRVFTLEGTPINRHCLDALRHAVHCYHFEVK
jgi:hypothetical protein